MSSSIPSWWSTYFPWEHKEKPTLSIIELKCTEHHKVADSNDGSEEPKLNCDGFIFTDESENLWYNQYPSASYGQLDDSSNWLATINFENEEEYTTAADANVVIERKDLAKYLADILYGVHKQLEDEKFCAKKSLLEKHYEEVVLLFEQQFKKKVVVKPRVTENGRKLKGNFKVTFENSN
jgi:hypothetical protein